ncbi:MAG: hypothetical protein V5A62_05795 [Haloarculaceae archaeon]
MTLPRAAFERGVRRLDESEARGFVSGLFEARGYRTSVEDGVVTATDGSGESTRLLVVDGVRSLPAAASESGVDAVLVTDGRLGAAARSLAARAASRGSRTDPAAVLGPGTLYEWFAYAVDAEVRSVLIEEYLDATEPTVLGRGRTAFVDAVGTAAGRLGGLSPPSRRTGGVVLVALLVLVVTVAAGPAGPLVTVGPGTAGDAGRPPPVTAVPVTATPAPATTEAGAELPEACPPPPLGAHPASLRPGVIRTASADGLDGWRLLVTQNISEYEFDPNDQRADAVPDIRHIAVFETSGGVRLRLVLDRWRSVARAERAVTDGGTWALGLRWGTYTAGVEWNAGDAAGDATARQLLAAVTTLEGVQLGGACVSALATGPATSDGNATA